MRILLLRHGITEANEKHLYCGSTDLPLSPAGRAALRRQEMPAPGTRFITSGMRRCNETLEALFGTVPYEIEPDFREIDFGDFEMRSYQELQDDPAFQAWCQDAEHNTCPNGESAPQVLARNLAALQPVLDAGQDAVCIIHGGVTGGLMMHWFGGIRYDYPVAPGTGYQVPFENGRPMSYRPVP